MKKGESQEIPIPKEKSDIETLCQELEEDKADFRKKSISELEAEIDEIVYNLFDISKEEQRVIEDYIQIFK